MKSPQPLGRIYNAILKVWTYIGETEWESYKKDAGVVQEKGEKRGQDGE